VTCLYCGALLGAEGVARAGAASSAVATSSPEGAPRERTLLVLDLDGVGETTLARVLGVPPYEAGLLARRGGFHLHRILEPGTAAEEAARLGADSLRVVLVPEAEARCRPVRATGGRPEEGALALRTEEGPLTVRGDDLLLVVSGPITREYRPPPKRRKVATATLEEGYRVHLHRRTVLPAVELDAANFEFGFAVTGSARLELDAWVAAAAPGVPRDDGFRRVTPALGPAGPEPKGPLAAAAALGHATRGRSETSDDTVVVLDNAEQFRFYSAWRAAVERRRGRPAA
jgi:hypothetical protein